MDIRYISASGYDLWSAEAVTSSGTGYGSIQLEYGWQLIAAPVTFGFWNSTTHAHVHDGSTVAKFKNYILDQIEDLYGAGVVEVANTYLGDNQFFWGYVVGSTPESSLHNFQLVYSDGASQEISGFWVKISGGSAPYTITWGDQP